MKAPPQGTENVHFPIITSKKWVLSYCFNVILELTLSPPYFASKTDNELENVLFSQFCFYVLFLLHCRWYSCCTIADSFWVLINGLISDRRFSSNMYMIWSQSVFCYYFFMFLFCHSLARAGFGSIVMISFSRGNHQNIFSSIWTVLVIR